MDFFARIRHGARLGRFIQAAPVTLVHKHNAQGTLLQHTLIGAVAHANCQRSRNVVPVKGNRRVGAVFIVERIASIVAVRLNFSSRPLFRLALFAACKYRI